ncbi:hypothetical protein [Lutibacter sp. B1]|uniref:hypothetical protein n=1 Tax=Lutibacter sp. B1 TaxID=2725996 RepID=UPI001456B45A|nr:hypothetical protein [Lutibacter sp. B1]NLP59077.1 hypothetical protein [Lutibacter sp. B1]
MKKITSTEAKELNNNFVKTRSLAIDNAIGKKDALSSWFSLQELKDYIKYVEDEGKLKGIDISGLRVYFGAYPEKDKKPSKKNFSTVFFVPTKLKAGSNLKDGLVVSGDNADIEVIDGLNGGSLGNPPSATYPQ